MKSNLQNNNNAVPWRVIVCYCIMVITNWSFAYIAESQPEVIINSWSVLFPLISFFYSAFCVITLIGLYGRTNWGFGLSFVTILLGAVLSAISYLLIFRLYPAMTDIFIAILVFNLVVIVYLVVYCISHSLNED